MFFLVFIKLGICIFLSDFALFEFLLLDFSFFCFYFLSFFKFF